MIQEFILAGFFAAHSIWCVSDGETLIPLVGYNNSEGKRELHRMGAPEVSEAAAQGKEFLESLYGKATEAVLCYDGYLTVSGVKMDAIFIEIRSYTELTFEAVMAVAYQPAKDGRGFKVYRPKFIKIPDGADANKLREAFFHGVGLHKQGSETWNSHIDESR